MATSNMAASALFNVNGLVAVVTGAGTGIGLMMTKALAANGAHRIYIVGRRQGVLRQVAEDIDPQVVIPLPGDVTSHNGLLDLAKHIESETGYVNLVVANAGKSGPWPLKSAPNEPPPTIAEYREHALKTSMEDFTRTYEVNTTSVYYTALAFLSLLDLGNRKGNMGKDWKSQVVATSSIGGYSRMDGASFAYNSSKAAVTHMMKMMANCFIPYKIRCNVLAPGIFPSELTGEMIKNLRPGPDDAIDSSLIPAERVGKEEDIAGAILYLASKAGAYLNGSVVMVDGGRLGTLVSSY